MRNKARAQELNVGVDEEVELAEDGEPDVVGADDQCVVVVVRAEYGVEETVGARNEVGDFGREVAAPEWIVERLSQNKVRAVGGT